MFSHGEDESRIRPRERVDEPRTEGPPDRNAYGRPAPDRSAVASPRAAAGEAFAPIQLAGSDVCASCYLLGCYLGDGNVAHPSPNGWELRLACDQRYVDIMDEIRAAAALTFPNAQPTTFASSTAASAIVRISHPGIAEAFPQHGPGRKHLRRIVLATGRRS